MTNIMVMIDEAGGIKIKVIILQICPFIIKPGIKAK